MSIAYDLDRFVAAQDAVDDDVLRELRNGNKRSHWMWFIFPQMAGLGRSQMAQRYAITSLGEARAYAAHPILGARLRECTTAVLTHAGTSVVEIFGEIDALKFCSSMTLFAMAAEDDGMFVEALERFCGGRRDEATIRLVRLAGGA